MNIKNTVYIRASSTLIMVALAYAVLTAFLLHGVLIGKTTFFKGDDITIQSYAWLTKVFTAAREGRFALWSFGTMSGVSFIGELQTAPLYPLALLWAFLVTPGDTYGLDLFIAFHFFLGAVGMHALGRTFGIPHPAAAVGAVVFSFAGAIAVRASGQPNIHAGLVYMPYVLLAIIQATRRAGLSLAAWSALAGLALAMTFLSGHAYGTVHALLAGMIAAAMVILPEKLPFRQAVVRLALVFSILGVVALLVAAPQIVATGEYLARAYKWYGPSYTSAPHIVPYSQYAKEGLSFADLATVYTGKQSEVDGVTLFGTWTAVIAILLGVCLVVLQRRRSLPLEIGGVIVAVALVIALSAPYRLGELLYHIPLLNIVRTPARAANLYALGMSLMAAAAVGIIQECVGRLVTPIRQGAALSPQFSAAGFLVALAFLGATVWEARIATEHRLVSVARAGYPANSVQNDAAVHTLMALVGPESQRYRVHSTTDAIPPNLGDIMPVLTTDGHRSTRLKNYHEWFDYNPLSQRMDMLGVRWWVSETPVEGLPEVGRVGKLLFYERPTALPVFWLAQADGTRAPAPISKIAWDVNSVRVEMEHPISGLLVFAQPTYPGWKAFADDAKVRLIRNEIFMAVDLTTPARLIEFRYAPAWFFPLLLLAVATILASLALCLAAAIWPNAEPAT